MLDWCENSKKIFLENQNREKRKETDTNYDEKNEKSNTYHESVLNMFDMAENLMKASSEANDLYNDDTQSTYTELISILLNFWREKLQKIQTRSMHSDTHKIFNDETSPSL